MIDWLTGFYEGMLWKKGKDNAQFLQRKFVLSEKNFTLTYYNKENVSDVPAVRMHFSPSFLIVTGCFRNPKAPRLQSPLKT